MTEVSRVAGIMGSRQAPIWDFGSLTDARSDNINLEGFQHLKISVVLFVHFRLHNKLDSSLLK